MSAKKAKGRKSAGPRKTAAPAAKSPSSRAGSGSRGGSEVGRIRELLKLMEEHGVVELEVGPDGKSVRISKQGTAMPAMAAPVAVAAPAEAEAETDTREGLEKFLSPMVGTFYRAASPESASYVVEGDQVATDATLCIIEAMKVFNEIKAEYPGKVVEILVENGEAVEYGQPLFLIKKSS